MPGLKTRYCGNVLEALLMDRLPSKYGIVNPDLPIWSTVKKVFSKRSKLTDIKRHVFTAINGTKKIQRLKDRI
jgi:hypothetical protein